MTMLLSPSGTTLFDTLVPQPADALLGIIAAHRADPRAGKIDLGVGVFRDDDGKTPVMRAVKAAERVLIESQTTKSYLGPDLAADWRAERGRINILRHALGEAHPALAPHLA